MWRIARDSCEGRGPGSTPGRATRYNSRFCKEIAFEGLIMSVRDRLEDARVLTVAGRQQGAFIQVLIAAAATSRKRYQKNEWDDSESFRLHL